MSIQRHLLGDASGSDGAGGLLSQLDPREVKKALQLWGLMAHNIEHFRTSPEGLYLSVVADQGGVSMASLMDVPDEILGQKIPTPFSWTLTPDQLHDARVEMKEYLKDIAAATKAKGGSLASFYPARGAAFGRAKTSPSSGGGVGGGGTNKSLYNVLAGDVDSVTRELERMNLSTMPVDQLAARMKLYNKFHANLKMLSALVDPELNGGNDNSMFPYIKSEILVYGEETALAKIQDVFPGITIANFLPLHEARRLISLLVGTSIGQRRALDGIAHQNRTYDDWCAIVQELVHSIYKHCDWNRSPNSSVTYTTDTGRAGIVTLRGPPANIGGNGGGGGMQIQIQSLAPSYARPVKKVDLSSLYYS